MPESHHPIQNHASALSASEHRVAHRLDALGRLEQASADPSLEERIFEATRPLLPRAPGPRVFRFHAALATGFPARVALAACLALAGAAGWYASRGLFSPAQPVAPGAHVALADLEAEAGFTLDALLASYRIHDAGESASGDPDAFWSSDADLFADLDEEISL